MKAYKVSLYTKAPRNIWKCTIQFVNGGIDEAILLAKVDFVDKHNSEYIEKIQIGLVETRSIELLADGDY